MAARVEDAADYRDPSSGEQDGTIQHRATEAFAPLPPARFLVGVGNSRIAVRASRILMLRSGKKRDTACTVTRILAACE